VFSHLLEEFKSIYREAAPTKIIGMIIKGDNLFYVMRDLLNITNRQSTKAAEQAQPREEVQPESLGSSLRFIGRLLKMIVSF
jgi:hypothetical protein